MICGLGLPNQKFWLRLLIGDCLKNFFEDLFFCFFWRALALVSLVLGLGLEHSCPWPRECLSSERLSLALASDFFVSLALASSLVSSTPPLFFSNMHCLQFIYIIVTSRLTIVVHKEKITSNNNCKKNVTITRWEFASKPSDRPTQS